jgi:ABC-type transport system involved in multi-copper enzyme maturation permease subunit
MSARILWALALSDFRERVRRPAFLAILLAAVALGYAAAPPASADYALLSVGGYRGVYDSEYLGTVLALMGGMWLSFAGFYVVKNSIARDATTGVGQILAATPVRRTAYTFGKFLSNFMVVIALTAILALMAPVMQLLRGESAAIHPAGLWLPFLLFPLP